MDKTPKNKRDTYRYLSYGGDGRDRTVDLLNAIQALSQLSYAPKAVLYYHIFHHIASKILKLSIEIVKFMQ